MEKGKGVVEDDETEEEASDFILCQLSECEAYLIPSNAPYRTADWNLDKPFWQGVLKVTSKGDDCIIRLEHKYTGELYVRGSYTEEGVKPATDSDSHFVLEIEEAAKTCEIVSCIRFIGFGFRNSTEAFDFRAAPRYCEWYLDKKKAAKEMKQKYQTSSVDYSIKEGETLILKLKNKSGGCSSRSIFFEQGLNDLLEDNTVNPGTNSIVPRLLPPPPRQLPPPVVSAENETVTDESNDEFGDFEIAWSPFD